MESLSCTCAKSEIKTSDHYVAVVYRLEYSQASEMAVFDFPKGNHNNLLLYLEDEKDEKDPSDEESLSPTKVLQAAQNATPLASASVKILKTTPQKGLFPAQSVAKLVIGGSIAQARSPQPQSLKRSKTASSRLGATRRTKLGSSEVGYNHSGDLEAASEPSKTLALLQKNISNGNWKDEFSALDQVRQLAIWHPDVLLPQFAVVAREVNRHVKSNLRSNVRKNAVLCLQTLFCTMGRQMETYLPVIIPTLLVRTADGNEFLAGEAEVALRALILHCNPFRALNVFIASGSSNLEKAAPIKAEAIKCIAWSVEQCGIKILTHKSLHKVVQCTAALLYDRSKHARAYARAVIHVLAYMLLKRENTKAKDTIIPELRELMVESAFNTPEIDYNSLIEAFQSTCKVAVPSKYRDRFDSTLQSAGVKFSPTGDMIFQVETE